MPLNGIFPDWMLPVTTGDAVTESIDLGDVTLVDTDVVVTLADTEQDLALPEDVQVAIIEDAPTITLADTDVVVSIDTDTDITVEGCD